MQSNKQSAENKVFTPDEILTRVVENRTLKGRIKRYIEKNKKSDNFFSKSSYGRGVRKIWREYRPQIMSGAVTLSVAVILCFLVNAMNISLGYEVIVDGETVGIVCDKEIVYDAIAEAQESLKVYLGEDTVYEKEPAFIRRVVSNKKLSDIGEIKSGLLSNVDTMVEGSVIYVAGEQILGVADGEAADWVLKKYKQKYAGSEIPDDMIVEFCEEIKVKKEYMHIGLLKTPEEALEVLSGNTRELASYVVQTKDTLWDIAAKYDTTVEHLLAINDNLSENIKDGMTIRVEESIPLLSVRSVQTVSLLEPVPYEVEKVDDATLYKGTTKVTQPGVEGEAEVLARITKINGIEKNKEILESETVREPIKQIERIGTKERPKTTGSGTFIRASYGSLSWRYGSRWGRNHTGIDIAGSYNSPIKAADGGVVTYAGWMSGYGNYVVINHENGYQTGYGHCASLCVKVGSRVAKGDVIAKMGNTGRSTGTHLHFEVKKNGSYVNPLSYVSY